MTTTKKRSKKHQSTPFWQRLVALFRLIKRLLQRTQAKQPARRATKARRPAAGSRPRSRQVAPPGSKPCGHLGRCQRPVLPGQSCGIPGHPPPPPKPSEEEEDQ